MNQGRLLPLLGPVVVLYLLAESVATTERFAVGAIAVLGVAGLLATVPILLSKRGGERRGVRRLGLMAVGGAVALVRSAEPGSSSLPLDVGYALGAPLLGLVAFELALDTPDRPAAIARRRSLRPLAGLLAVVAALGAIASIGPAIEGPGGPWVAPASWGEAGAAFAVLALTVALGLRRARRRLGSAPEALAANGWAELGLAGALLAFGAAAAARVLGETGAFRAAIAAGVLSLVAGHVALVDGRRQVRAGPNTRRVLAGIVALGGVAGLAVWAGDRLPSGGVGLALVTMLAVTLAALFFQLAGRFAERWLAPFGGRLVHATREAETLAANARSLEELGAAVLGPLRRASGALDADPLLFAWDPEREVRIDAAGLAHVEDRPMPPALRAHLAAEPAAIVIRAPLEGQVVRRADLRPLVEALVAMDAFAVVPLSIERELEGALAIPRGRRRSPLTLEEIDALERLARAMVGRLAACSAEERSRRRTRDAVLGRAALEEALELAREENASLREEASLLKSGGATERLRAPLVAYSPAMRELTRRLQEVAALDAPVLLSGPAGAELDRVAYLLHGGGGRAAEPFVVADCAAVRPERGAAALFGEGGSGHPGWLRLAAGGTCLLLDVPALSLEAQAQLADALATRRALPADDRAAAYPLDARIVLTSRLPLEPLEDAGAFDPELRRRLEPLSFEVAPLRERPEDIPSLVLLALDHACRVRGRAVLGVDEDALEALVAHSWPGDAAELRLAVERAVERAEGPRVHLHDLPPLASAERADPLEGTHAEVEARILSRALARAGGNKSEAARLLGLPRTTFVDKLRRHHLDRETQHPPKPEVSA